MCVRRSLTCHSLLSLLVFFYCSRAHHNLHSFPTRRSSDLETEHEHLVDLGAVDAVGERDAEVARAEPLRDLGVPRHRPRPDRSEEHTSELQSLRHLVCRLLLEKKKKKNRIHKIKK